MRKTLIIKIIILILLITPASAVLIINEIMYDPPGRFDDDLEWIEIYNNSTEELNLSNWLVNGKDFGDIILSPTSYVIIARELIDDDNDGISFESVYGNNDSVWDSSDIIMAVEGSLILNNNEDAINLSNGSLEYLAKYNHTLGGNNNGHSLEFVNGAFIESYALFGTPGKNNSINNSINISSIKIIPNDSEACDISISVITDKTIYNNEVMHFSNILNQNNFPFIIEYWIEDAFGNIAKEKINTTNTNKKQFTPSIKESLGVFLIKNRAYPSCNDTNISNNIGEKLIVVRNNKTSEDVKLEEESKINIEDVSGINNEISHGDTIKVKLNIYKGNTRKSAVKVWIEDKERISEITTINLEDKYTNYKLTLPIKLDDDCKIESGSYRVIAEGLDTKDKSKKKIDFKPCKEESHNSSTSNKQKASTKKEEKNSSIIGQSQQKIMNKAKSKEIPNASVEFKSKKISQQNYKSRNDVIKSVIPWLIAGITTLISIVLIWKR